MNELDLNDGLAALSPEKRALLESLLEEGGESLDTFPPSFAQQRIWFLDQLAPGSARYALPVALRLRGGLDADTLERSLLEIVRRHEVLRTRYLAVDGKPVQVVSPDAGLRMSRTDLRGLEAAERETELRRRIEAAVRAPFRLDLDPVLRAELLALQDDEHVLLVILHHIAADGWSLGVLVREMAEIYPAFAAGSASPLPELEIQYADFAIWQRQWLTEERLEGDLAYWRQQLAGLEPVGFPTDRTCRAGGESPAAWRSSQLEPALSGAIHTLAESCGATPFMVLLAAFQALLHRHTGRTDLALGSPVANRTRSEVEGLIGLFVNSLVLRADFSGDPDFLGLVRQVRETVLDAQTHQDLPFEKLVEELQPERALDQTPFFRVLLALQDAPAPPLESPGLRLEPIEAFPASAPFDLTLSLAPSGGGYRATALYRADRFETETIDALLSRFETLLRAVLATPGIRISELPLVGPAEREAIARAAGEVSEPPAVRCLHEVFADRAIEAPDSLAIAYRGETIGYGELERRAERLAGRLLRLGIAPESRVALCLDRSPRMIAAILAVWKAGGAYLPLDPAHPRERLAALLDDAAPALVLTQERHRAALPESSVPIVCLDAADETDADESGTVDAPRRAATTEPEGLAYLIYTSGSTGKPKAVAVTHGGLANFTRALAESLGVEAGERILQFASLAFDASVWEMAMAFGAGGALFLADRDDLLPGEPLARTLREGRIQGTLLPPSALALLPSADFPELRVLVAGGEACPQEIVDAWSPGRRFFNAYGPTEVTVCATLHEDREGVRFGIGRPLLNATLHLLDRYLNPVPFAVPGEVFVGGLGVARGYLDRSALTAERFLPDPFGERPGARLYRTGDLARRRRDGELEYLGRIDDQVKVRGIRIELGEVEAALASLPEVARAAVVVRGEGAAAALVGYVELRQGRPLTADDLRQALRRTLPESLVPSRLVVLEKLPLTASGKPDRRALPALDGDRDLATPYVAPRSPVEELVAGIWAELLERDRVGVEDSFFDLGGHSLLATRLTARLRQAFAIDLPLRRLFEAPTVAGLAAAIAAARGSEPLPPIARIGRDGGLRLSFAQERLWFLQQLEPASAAYNLGYSIRMRGPLDLPALERSLNALVERHEVFRTAFLPQAGAPRQIVLPELALRLAKHDSPPDSTGEHLERSLAELTGRPFDLTQAPLLRAALLRMAGDEHVLQLAFHHIVSDAWSNGILTRELALFYDAFSRGRSPVLPELKVQYADFAAWQRERAEEGGLEAGIAYWRRQLSGLRVLPLPTDRPRPALQSLRGARQPLALPADLAADLETFSRRRGVTLYMSLLAAWQCLLHRYTGQDDIAVGSPLASRTRPEVEGLIGFFVNLLVLRGDLAADPSFSGLLAQAREVCLDAYAHQEVPFERLVEELQPERDLSRSPLFQVLLVLQNTPSTVLELAGLELTALEAESLWSKYDLTLSLAATERGLAGWIEYPTDLFEAATIERLGTHLRTLLAGAIAEPSCRLSELPLLSALESRQILSEWNRTAADVPADLCIHHLIEAQAEATPDAVAAVFRHQKLTYRELNEAANRLARHLAALGVAPEARVGVFLHRSLEMLVSLVAVLKAGGAYVPIDPLYPAERLALMIEDSGVAVILTRGALLGALPQTSAVPVAPVAIVDLDGIAASLARRGAGNLESGVRPENLAYVIYTSGSTGRPKGVMVGHGNAVNFFAGMDLLFGTSPEERGTWLAVTSISFDISVLELLWTLTRGFRVVIQPEAGTARAAAPTQSSSSAPRVGFSLFYFASAAQAEEGEKYRLLLEGARFADRNGFEAVWTPERHFHPFGGLYPNPAVTGAAIAAVTRNVAVRAGSVVMPLQNPLRVAEEWSVVDNLSGGRAGISFASGWHADDFVLAPQNYLQRKHVLERDVEVVRRLWRGEAARLKGGTGAEVEVRIHPRPIQAELPFWLTASGSPETFRLAGELGANLLTHLLTQSVEELAQKIRAYRDAWSAAGHPGRGQVTLMVHTYVGEDLDEVRRVVRQPFCAYLRGSLELMGNLARSLGRDPGALSAEEEQTLLDHAFERYFGTASLFGTPEGCRRTVATFTAAGVDEVACLIDFGIEADAVLAALEHLGTLRELVAPSPRPEPPAVPEDESLPAQIAQHGVTHLQCTPSLARILASDAGSLAALRPLRRLLLGGEALPPDLAARLVEEIAGSLHNMYGPTETTIWSATHPVADGAGTVPLGQPIANTEIYVLDRRLQPVPPSVAGEIYIGGRGVARGYLGRPELSAERFVPDPFGSAPGARLYRTGDLGRRRGDGMLEFLGREDQQVKIGGHRIEPGEIEAALASHPDVEAAVVLAREDQPGARRLVAYVVPGAGVLRPLRPTATPDQEVHLLAGFERCVLPNGLVVAHFDEFQATLTYREIFERRSYLRHGVALQDGDCVFDVGANAGLFTLFARQQARDLRSFAFEPIPRTFRALQANARLYGLDAELFACGLAERAGTAEFTFYPRISGLSSRYSDRERDKQATRAIMETGLAEAGGAASGLELGGSELEEALEEQFRFETHTCELQTLSGVIASRGVERIDLLKIDVERAELDVLRGLAEADWPKVRQVVAEVDTPENLAAMTELLERHGFRVAVDDLFAEARERGVFVSMLYARRVDAQVDQPAAREPGELALGALREHLRQRLPEPMIPAAWVVLDALPLTPNGKLDRRALPAPDGHRLDLGIAYVAPHTELQGQIAEVWRRLLQVERVGLDDNFFELGGSSLLAVQLRSQLRDELGADLTLVDLFRHPTVSALANHLEPREAPAPALDRARERARLQRDARRRPEVAR